MTTRSERLLALMQALRRRRRPVTADILAQETGVSKRSIYRDIATLKASGAMIEGAAGLGYVVRAEHWLPPLTFDSDEIEALVLGLRSLVYGPDAGLSQAARDAEAKLMAVLPPAGRAAMQAVALFSLPTRNAEPASTHLVLIRQALREEKVLQLHYNDLQSAESCRTVWPLALGYRDGTQMLLAHCTLRDDFRQFRVLGITGLALTGERMRNRRQSLLGQWLAQNQLPDMR